MKELVANYSDMRFSIADLCDRKQSEALLKYSKRFYFQEVISGNLISSFLVEIVESILPDMLIQAHESHFQDRVNNNIQQRNPNHQKN